MSKEILNNTRDLISRAKEAWMDFAIPYYVRLKYEGSKQDRFFSRVVIAITGGVLEEFGGSLNIGGYINQENAVLVAANHQGALDGPILLQSVTKIAKRTATIWVKDTLLNPNIRESEEVLMRTTQRDLFSDNSVDSEDLNRANFFKLLARKVSQPAKNLLRYQLTPLWMKQFYPIPVSRSNDSGTNRRAVTDSLRELKANRVLATFFQGTRRPEGDLLNFKDGVADLAIHNPDTTVIPACIVPDGGFLIKRHQVRFGKGFTFNGIKNCLVIVSSEGPKQALRDAVSRYVADRIGELIDSTRPFNAPSDLNNEWFWDSERRESGITKNEALEINSQISF